MRIRFRVGDQEAEGQARDLSTLGAFVLTDPPDDEAVRARVELTLDSGQEHLRLTGEVLRVTAEGFAVAFSQLPAETLDRLHGLLQPDASPTSPPAPEPTPDDWSVSAFEIQGESWRPPVREPVLHQWRPAKDLLRPPPAAETRSGWESLPTLSPLPEEPAATAQQKTAPGQSASADRPDPSPEDKARQLLSGAAPPPATGPSPTPTAEPSPTPTAEPSPSPTAEPSPSPAEGHRPEAQTRPAEADQRKSERHERSVPVSFDNLTGLIKEFTHNISYGGMFVYAHQPQAEGTQTAVTLIHPVHGERLSLLAKVVHTSRAPTPDPVSGQPRWGLGLEFSIPLPELKRLLADFIGSHQRSDADPSSRQLLLDAQAVLARGEQSDHALLGLSEDAGRDEVRQAYFKLVDRFHPDRYFDKVGDSDRKLLEGLFRRLTKAYEKLTV